MVRETDTQSGGHTRRVPLGDRGSEHTRRACQAMWDKPCCCVSAPEFPQSLPLSELRRMLWSLACSPCSVSVRVVVKDRCSKLYPCCMTSSESLQSLRVPCVRGFSSCWASFLSVTMNDSLTKNNLAEERVYSAHSSGHRPRRSQGRTQAASQSQPQPGTNSKVVLAACRLPQRARSSCNS